MIFDDNQLFGVLFDYPYDDEKEEYLLELKNYLNWDYLNFRFTLIYIKP